MPMFYDMLYFKLLVATRFKNYWSSINLCSVSSRAIIALQKRYMERVMKLVLTR